MAAKQRLTITVDPGLVDAGQQAVDAGEVDSLSQWVSTAIAEKVARDEKLAHLASAIADFEVEHGEITDDEISAQLRADRSAATIVRRKPKSA